MLLYVHKHWATAIQSDAIHYNGPAINPPSVKIMLFFCCMEKVLIQLYGNFPAIVCGADVLDCINLII